MKKTLSLFLALLFCFLCCACAVQRPTTLAGELMLPEDGVLSAETLSALQTERKAVTLRGETDGLTYTWTLFGGEIDEPRDCNFALRSIRADKKRIELAFASGEGFGFSPVLTVFLPHRLNADVAAVCRAPGGEESFVCAASVTTTKNGGAVSFPVADPTGVYVITPEPRVPVTAEPDLPDEPDEPTAAATTAPTAAHTVPAATGEPAAPTKPSATAKPPATTAPTTAGPAAPTEAVSTTAAAAATVTTTTAAEAPRCTFSIECGTIFQHLEDLEPGKLDALPPDGVILPGQTVTFTQGESVFDVLKRLCREKGIPMEASYVPLYQSAYVEGIHNLYEFDCGSGSGWMYRVNGDYPNFGCSRYALKSGDTVEFRYTCDLGADIGGRNDFSTE